MPVVSKLSRISLSVIFIITVINQLISISLMLISFRIPVIYCIISSVNVCYMWSEISVSDVDASYSLISRLDLL